MMGTPSTSLPALQLINVILELTGNPLPTVVFKEAPGMIADGVVRLWGNDPLVFRSSKPGGPPSESAG